MLIYNIKDFRSWFIGDFDPTILRTKDFEVGMTLHSKGQDWPEHYHKIATEYTLLVSGRMKIGNQELESGAIFIIEPNEIVKPEFLEDCIVVVIKVPSIPGDKYGPDHQRI